MRVIAESVPRCCVLDDEDAGGQLVAFGVIQVCDVGSDKINRIRGRSGLDGKCRWRLLCGANVGMVVWCDAEPLFQSGNLSLAAGCKENFRGQPWFCCGGKVCPILLDVDGGFRSPTEEASKPSSTAGANSSQASMESPSRTRTSFQMPSSFLAASHLVLPSIAWPLQKRMMPSLVRRRVGLWCDV